MTPEEFLSLNIAGITVIDMSLIVLALTLIPAIGRVAAGPSDADRAVGADHVFFVLVGVIVLLAVGWDRMLLLDLVVIATLIGFLSALILGRYLGREGSEQVQS